jgi:ankyrin repeat protein
MPGMRALQWVIPTAGVLGLLWMLQPRPNPARERRNRFEQAIAMGDPQRVGLMLDAGEPVDGYPQEPGYLSPLAVAAMDGHTGVVRLLLDRGADVHARTTWGTPFEVTAQGGRVPLIELLVRHGALERDRQSQLDAALWGAAQYGRTNAVRYLLERGANPTQRHPDEGTLIELCRSRGLTQVVTLLEKATARRQRSRKT